MPNIKVITDSACDLPMSTLAAHGVTMVPLTIRFDEEEFVDQVELSTAQFWAKAEHSSSLPSTAAPSPGAYAEAFRAAKADGFDAVICLTLSAGLSGTHQSAVGGAQDVRDEIPVVVIDTATCTVGEAQLVLSAAEVVKSATSLDEAVATIRDLVSRQVLVGALDTLDNLRKNGRIGAAGAFFGAILAVKPVITIRPPEGKVEALAKQRTRSKALKALAQLVLDAGDITAVGISHSGAPDLEDFIAMLSPKVAREDLLITDMGATIGVHGGPRLIAVSYRTVGN